MFIIFRGLEERTASHSELMSSVKDFINSINVTRGNEMYMVGKIYFSVTTKHIG